MGFVTYTTTEYVGELTQSTSVHFEDFNDFKVWENYRNIEYSTGSLEGFDITPWTSHDGEGNPLEQYTPVKVQFKNGEEASGDSNDFYGWDWDTGKLDGYEEGYQIVGYKLI